jgi:hypothetical protein
MNDEGAVSFGNPFGRAALQHYSLIVDRSRPRLRALKLGTTFSS